MPLEIQVSELDCVDAQDPMSSSLKEAICNSSDSIHDILLETITTKAPSGIIDSSCDSVQCQISSSTRKEDFTDNPPEHEYHPTENDASPMIKAQALELSNTIENDNGMQDAIITKELSQTVEVSNTTENDSNLQAPGPISSSKMEELIVDKENKEKADGVTSPTKGVMSGSSDPRQMFRKMKSTGNIIAEPEDIISPVANKSFSSKLSAADSKTDIMSHTDDEDEIDERPTMTTTPSNRTLPANLDSINVDCSYAWDKTKICTSSQNINTKEHITDSHTSYRIFLEQNTVALKMQLAEAQEKADTADNDRNLSRKECHTLHENFVGMKLMYDESTRLVDGLNTVVTHLQSNAKDCAAERTSLYSKLDEYEKEREIMTRSSKQLRFENRKLKKDAMEARRELEGERMKIQGLKSENEWLKKESNINKSIEDDNTGNDDNDGGDNALPAIAELGGNDPAAISELRHFLKPQKSNENFRYIPARMDTIKPCRQSPPNNLPRPESNTDDDNYMAQFKAISTASHGTSYISFADVHLHPGSGKDIDISEDDEIVAKTILLPTTVNTSIVVRKTDTRKVRRKSSVVARNIFNALASKHIERSMDVSEDEASQMNIPSKYQRQRRKGSGISVMNRLQLSNGIKSLDRTVDGGIEKDSLEKEDSISCATEDLSQRWQDVLESPKRNYSISTPIRKKSNVDDDHAAKLSTAENSLNPSKWNWLWWKNDNNAEDVNEQTEQTSQPEEQHQQAAPWFLDDDNDSPIPPPIHQSDRNKGQSVGVSITRNSILSQEGSATSSHPTGLENMLVPRRMENPLFS